MTKDEHNHLKDCQARWFINSPRDMATRVWNKWKLSKSKEYMDDLTERINRIKNDQKSR